MKQKHEPQADVRYAGFGKRLDAFTIDLVIVLIISFTLYSVVVLLFKQNHGDNIIFMQLTWTIFFIYNIYFINESGRTPGKRFLKLRVVNNDLKKPDLKHIILRELVGRFIDNLTLLSANLLILFNKKKRSLHDFIGKTYVIQE
jgi:uncharacterized RDD family membrane protein YckC